MTKRIALKIDGTGWVRTGIPFAEGMLADAANVRVVRALGGEIASQVAVTGRWPDGSVRWTLLDFEAGEGDCAVEYGADVKRAASASLLTVTDGDDGVVVDTGAIRFSVCRARMCPISQAQVGGRTVLGDAELTVTLPDGSVRRSSGLTPTGLEVEEAGPLHAVVRVEVGDALDSGHRLQHIVRVHAWAGSPDVLMAYTLVNGTPREAAFDAATNVTLKGFGVHLPLDLPGGTAMLGGDQGTLEGKALRLGQTSALAYQADADGQAASGGRAPGWAAVCAPDAWAGVSVAHFWQKFRGLNYEKLSIGKKSLRWVTGVRFLPELILGRFLFGYGERPVRVLVAGAIIILLCALFYSTDLADLTYRVDPEQGLEFFDGLYFSTITFTTLGLGDIYPDADSNWLTRVVTMFESLSGASLMALFVVCLSKRFSRG